MGKGISCVYKIFFHETDKFYVGSTKNFKTRKARHLRELKNGIHNNATMQNVFNKYGDPVFEILEMVESWDCPVARVLLLNREQHYIDTLNPYINLQRTAGNYGGLKHTEESKKKMKAGRKRLIDSGWVNPLIGRKLSAEVKKRMSEAGKKNPAKYWLGKKGKDAPAYGVKCSEEKKKKIGNSNKGKVRTEELKIKWSKIKRSKGKLTEDNVREIRRLWEVEKTPQVEIAKIFNIKPKHVSTICTYTTWKDI